MQVCGEDIEVRGGVIRTARLVGDGYLFLDDPRPVVERLREAGRRVDVFTFTQRLPETSPKFPYVIEWENLAVLPVSTFDNWWANQIRSYPRNRARQATKKGVILREVPFDEALVRGIREVYNECPIRQGRPFRHYGESYETVYAETATFLERSIFIGAFLSDKLIGFVKLVHDQTRTQANLMNIVAMIGHKDKAPTNALIAEAVRSCADRGISYLVYQRFAYGRRQTDSMSHFKEVNGFRRVDLPRYYVPLTGVGRVALRLGLQRRLTDRLPATMIAKLRNLRDLWYNRRFRAIPEAY